MQPLLACQHNLPAAMASISVRGLSEQHLEALKGEAARQGISMNRLVLRLLTQEEEPEGSGERELDALAGTWTEQEAEAFMTAIAPMEQIDPELWG
jgi:plasmid stability protein